MNYMLNPGDLLVAPPKMLDLRFKETVILITDHDHKGTVGFALNKTTPYKVNDLITPLNVELPWDPLMHWGGPVCQDISFMLHSPEWSMDEYTRNISDDWNVTQHWSMFTHLSDGDEPQHWRIFAGCCAWAPGQLDREIQGIKPWTPQHSWLIINNPDAGALLEIEPDDLWPWACDRVAAQTVSSWLS